MTCTFNSDGNLDINIPLEVQISAPSDLIKNMTSDEKALLESQLSVMVLQQITQRVKPRIEFRGNIRQVDEIDEHNNAGIKLYPTGYSGEALEMYCPSWEYI